jgi:hypothetical protein
MLPQELYARANGMISLVESGSGLIAPILAGALIGLVGNGGKRVIAAVTFCAAPAGESRRKGWLG